MTYLEDATLVGDRPVFDPAPCFSTDAAVAWARSVPGWMSYKELTWLAEQADKLPAGGTWLEVGTWKGRSFAAVVLSVPDGCRVLAVDHWQGTPGENENQASPAQGGNAWRHFLDISDELNRLRPTVEIGHHCCASVIGALQFADNSLDVVFIDAAHDFKSVLDDLKAWLPKVKPGGLLCGHDGNDGPVRKALEEMGLPCQIAVHSIWSYRKPAIEKRRSVTQWEYSTLDMGEATTPESMMAALTEAGREGWEFVTTVQFAGPPKEIARMNARGVMEVATLPGAIICQAWLKRRKE